MNKFRVSMSYEVYEDTILLQNYFVEKDIELEEGELVPTSVNIQKI